MGDLSIGDCSDRTWYRLKLLNACRIVKILKGIDVTVMCLQRRRSLSLILLIMMCICLAVIWHLLVHTNTYKPSIVGLQLCVCVWNSSRSGVGERNVPYCRCAAPFCVVYMRDTIKNEIVLTWAAVLAGSQAQSTGVYEYDWKLIKQNERVGDTSARRFRLSTACCK